MKSYNQFAAKFAAVFAATVGSAMADGAFNVPEPGTLALVGVAVAALVAFSSRGKK